MPERIESQAPKEAEARGDGRRLNMKSAVCYGFYIGIYIYLYLSLYIYTYIVDAGKDRTPCAKKAEPRGAGRRLQLNGHTYIYRYINIYI